MSRLQQVAKHDCQVYTLRKFGRQCQTGTRRLQSNRRADISCMANPRRVARVSKQIEREIGTLLQGDQVLVNALCPEQRLGYDSSVSAVASVTEVRLSSDLQVAKVYVSVFSDEEGRTTAIKGLSKLQGYVRTKLAHQMQLRMVPEIRFIHDEAAERGEEVLQLLERIKRQDAGTEDLPPVTIANGPQKETANAQNPAKSRKLASEGDPDTDDGFLDLNEDLIEEGFLDEDDDYGAATDVSIVDDDEEEEEEEDEDDELGEDRTEEVVNSYLQGMPEEDENDDVVISSRSRKGRGRRK